MKLDGDDVSDVAMAVEEKSEASRAGPSPSLMMARESGMILVCHPLSLWNFCMADSVCESQWPEGSPERYPDLTSEAWIWLARVSSMARWPVERAALLARVCLLKRCGEVGPRWECVSAGQGRADARIRVELRRARPNRIL